MFDIAYKCHNHRAQYAMEGFWWCLAGKLAGKRHNELVIAEMVKIVENTQRNGAYNG